MGVMGSLKQRTCPRCGAAVFNPIYCLNCGYFFKEIGGVKPSKKKRKAKRRRKK